MGQINHLMTYPLIVNQIPIMTPLLLMKETKLLGVRVGHVKESVVLLPMLQLTRPEIGLMILNLMTEKKFVSLEIEHGREPDGFEFFDKTHKVKDGAYPDNTSTEEFINTAKSKILEGVSTESSKSQMEIEDEVFNDLMYDKDKTNQRPIGYWFGVKRNDAVGVHALLRKRGVTSNGNNNGNLNIKAELARHKRQTTDLIMRLTSYMGDVVSAVRSGRISDEMLDATESALHAINPQVSNSSGGDEEEDDGLDN